MKGVGLVGELVTPRGQSRGRKLPSGRRHRERRGRLRWECRSTPDPQIAKLGRTMHAWRTELLAHFDHPNVSNGPTET
jgi:transposase